MPAFRMRCRTVAAAMLWTLLSAVSTLPAAAAAGEQEPGEKAPAEAAEAEAAEKKAPQGAPFEMTSHQLVLLVRPADAPELPGERLQEIQRAHLAYLTRMGEEGKAVVCGPFGDQQDASLRGACIYDVGSVEEARRLASADPAVEAGRLEVEAVTWWVGKGSMDFPKRPAPEPSPEPSPEPQPSPAPGS